MSRTTHPFAVLGILTALVAVACSGSATGTPSPTPTSPASPTPSASPTPASDPPGTSEPSPSDPEGLLGEWVLVEMAGVAIPDDAGITATFGPGTQFGGSGGCNEYGGSYVVDGAAIAFSDVISTLIGCEGEVGQREGTFFATLDGVEAWSIAEGELTLSGPAGTDPLVFRSSGGDGATLEGPEWLLVTMGDRDVPPAPPITATFGANGQVTGSGGCNQYFADYASDESSLTVGNIGSTRMACEDEVMARETTFFEGLGSSVSWSLDGDRLVVMGPDGSEPLVFEVAS